MTLWQPGAASPQQSPWQQWPAAPMQAPPSAPGPRPGRPLPPPAVLLAAGFALGASVLLVVLLATGSVADLLGDTGQRRDDAAVLAALAGVLAVGGLLGGAVAVVTGRGAGLLRAAGAGVAVATLLLVVAATVLGPEVSVPALLLGLVVVLVGAAVAGAATTSAVAAWSDSAERRSAEREIAVLSPSRTAPLPARGAESLVLGLFLVGGVVLGAVGTVAAFAPDVAGAAREQPAEAPSGLGEAAPVPVDETDFGYDAYLDVLAQDCADGELAGCDDLYRESDGFSEYETYGSTCGGRTETEYQGSCAKDFD